MCLHVTNMTIFILFTAIATTTELVMYRFYKVKRDKDIISSKHEVEYLNLSFIFEIMCTTTYCFEFICSIIIGYLIIAYSKDKKAGLYIDPITNLKVPSLVFVYNQQQIINSMANVRSETHEQFAERL